MPLVMKKIVFFGKEREINKSYRRKKWFSILKLIVEMKKDPILKVIKKKNKKGNKSKRVLGINESF